MFCRIRHHRRGTYEYATADRSVRASDLIIACVPLVIAVIYMIRPTERHLALMRPLSLAGLFASLAGGVLGFINVLRVVWTRELTVETYRVIAVGSAESLVPTLVGFASLTAAWLFVAVGMGRQGARL
jgi:hypothetical protein